MARLLAAILDFKFSRNLLWTEVRLENKITGKSSKCQRKRKIGAVEQGGEATNYKRVRKATRFVVSRVLLLDRSLEMIADR